MAARVKKSENALRRRHEREEEVVAVLVSKNESPVGV